MLIETISGGFSKALLVNHPADAFDIVMPFAGEPLRTTASTADNDGILDLAGSANSVPNSLLLLPYAEGAEGDWFSMRLYGIRRFGNDAIADRAVWLPYLMGEYLCRLGNLPGPQSANPQNTPPVLGRFLLPTENLCDTIFPVHGGYGITSPGSDGMPGIGLTASILQGCYGSQKVYFDFQPEGGFSGSMNCAYAR